MKYIQNERKVSQINFYSFNVLQIQNINKMGNRHSQHGYSFEDQYNILGSSQANQTLFKLQDRQSGELLIGRQLSCNDQNEAYELECIIDQKLNNASPFVTKLLKSQSQVQDSYCGTTNKYYLLFREIPKVLADQINERKMKGQFFIEEEIDTVITRVSKGIKYLYDIYHDHNAVSSKSITWPKQPREFIQLIDEWALNIEGLQRKNRLYRPKDEQDINEKTLQKANDLYNLGLVAKQMMSVGSNRNQVATTPNYNQLRQKVSILMSNEPQNRFKIYSMLNTSTIGVGRQFRVSEATKANLESRKNNNNNMVIPNSNPVQPAFRAETTIPQQKNLNQLHFSNSNMNQQNISRAPYQQFPPQPPSFTPHNNNVKIGNISMDDRNVGMSLPKANYVNSHDQPRNLSANKPYIAMTTGPSQSVNLTANNKYSVPISGPQIPKVENSLPLLPVQSSQQVGFNQAGKKANVQFNNNSIGMSLSSQPYVSMAYNPAQIPNNSSLSFSNSLQSSLPTKIPTAPANNISSFGSNNVSSSMNVVPPIVNASSSFAPLTSNIQGGGLVYSFGQNSDQTLSFKGLSNSDENLFTSPDFFSKIKEQNNNFSMNKQQIGNPIQAGQINSINESFGNKFKTDEQNNAKYSFLSNQLAYSSQSQSNLNSFVHLNKTPIQSLKPSIPLNQKQVVPSFRQQNLPSSSANQSFKDHKKEQKGWQIPTISSVTGPSSGQKNNYEVFQNVTNIPVTKSIENPSGYHEIFDKIANSHTYAETPNIVVHEESKDADYVKTTPGKSKSNQPFSTIPQVSERSGSARSDDDKDYVIEEYQNGSRYEGFKSNGMRNGKGKFFYQEGSFYDGQWKNNNMHGFGKLFYSNNKLAYEGQWFIDQFHGKGKVYNDEPAPIFGYFDYTNFENLDQKWKFYEGDLVCDSKQGQGKLVLSNDQYYEGQFRNDKIDGKGRFVARNGETIKGIWEDSKLIMRL